ncbi:MAG: adenylate kinase, partial [Bacteroidales bacterium]
MLNIALFGPPGAGKGTQSEMLIKKYNLMYISTGEILRQEIAEGTDAGMRAKDVIEKGGLASDEIIVEIIENRIKRNPDVSGILFDGFPRTVVQAYILDGLMLRMQTHLLCMLSLDVPKDELKRRLLERANISGRSDDKEDVINFRLQEYENKTLPVADFYDQKGKYFLVDGVGKVEDIFQRLCNIVEKQAEKIWLNIVLCGFPGSGKRSHALLLEKKYDLVYISTGALIRKEIASDTEMGRIAKPFIESGDNVPDEIAIRLIERKIRQSTHAKGFIFKGFPSTFVQAYILDGLLKKMGSSTTCAINLTGSPLICMKRLSQRGKSTEARVYDKDPAIVLHRLEVYEKNSPKILDYYQKQEILYHVKDANNIQTSFVDICHVVDIALKKI